ncbi:DUF3800 domain-containing protein [uncultured Alistipes sp.]|jgi:hypothetical protein|uniref:DUF3800 domain-containing protein n=1 Tax=uncultured Alistipes sp. TaxID=538949 RepID=UPI0025DB8DAE|nr:DUF3800 domain-containing protein [uncultured Alistipes sp.]
MNFEIGDIRKATKLMNPDCDFDVNYTIYYDETNNIKTFYIRESGPNYDHNANFVLGGVLYFGDRPNVENIFEGLRLQKTVNEVKLKHLAKGNFQECLTSDTLGILLKRIVDSDLHFHSVSLNFLYWSIVDIVDSVAAISDVGREFVIRHGSKMKNDLYEVCKMELEDILDIFYRYNYPTIREDKIRDFIEELTAITSKYESIEEYHISLASLRQLLKECANKNELLYLTDNQSEDDEKGNRIIKDFVQFYLSPIYMFKNSTHILDEESEINAKMGEFIILDNGVRIQNYSFMDSKADKLIQLSDILTGLYGKFTTFINQSYPAEIAIQLRAFSPTQLDNLDLFLDIINKTIQFNSGLMQHFDSIGEQRKIELIKHLRHKTI